MTFFRSEPRYLPGPSWAWQNPRQGELPPAGGDQHEVFGAAMERLGNKRCE